MASRLPTISEMPPTLNARVKLPVQSRTSPKNYGPTVPPRLPAPLIRPMPTPATDGGSTSVGSVQNGPKRPRKVATASVRKMRMPTVLCARELRRQQKDAGAGRGGDHVPLALPAPIGAARHQQHRDDAHGVRQRGKQPDRWIESPVSLSTVGSQKLTPHSAISARKL